MEAYRCRVSRRHRLFLLAAWMFAATGLLSYAQPAAPYRDGEPAPIAGPGTTSAAPTVTADLAGGVICGTVLDANGAEVEGATVTLEGVGREEQHSAMTSGDGFFRFSSIGAGQLKVTVAAKGFSSWSTGLTLHPNEDIDLPPVNLEIALATTEVEVVYTRHDRAEAEIHAEEQQRVLGAIPNFYVSYKWDAEPLSRSQKYRLAWRTSIDPISIAFSLAVAGVEQSQNTFKGYGQGTQGYAKRFGASYADGLTGTFLANAILPSLLHQDPRYFYKGTGSIRSRALYAIANVVICKGDNGRWQPNYSYVAGSLAAAGISNLYYPTADRRGVELTFQNTLIDMATGAAGALFQEFLVKRISRGVEP